MSENKGIKSIFGGALEDFKEINKDSSTLNNSRKIDVEKIRPNPRQPRSNFKKEDLEALANSIRELGLLTPVSVTEENGYYTLIHGERRFRAIKLLGYNKIPAIIEGKKNETYKARAGLAENTIRVNLSPIEEARAYKQLIEKDKWTQEQIAKENHLSRSAVANKIRLLNLPIEIQNLINEGKIKEGHARQLLNLNSKEEIFQKAKEIIEEKLTVRNLESKTSKSKPRKEKTTTFQVGIRKELFKNNRYKSKIKIKENKATFTFDTEHDMREFFKRIGLIN